MAARINVYTYPTSEYDEEGPKLAGWFNSDSATRYAEATRWDGSNYISVNTGSQWNHETLFRTAQGRWVKRSWSDYEDREDRYEFVGDETAKDWLLCNEEDEAVEKWFGALEEESGPNLGGRPAIGPKWEVRLDDEAKRRVIEFAAGRPRADALRDLIAAGLDAQV